YFTAGTQANGSGSPGATFLSADQQKFIGWLVTLIRRIFTLLPFRLLEAVTDCTPFAGILCTVYCSVLNTSPLPRRYCTETMALSSGYSVWLRTCTCRSLMPPRKPV